MKYIYSTMSCGVIYNFWTKPAGDGSIPSVQKSIEIAGGAGVADKHFVTPLGVVTAVSDEDFDYLAKHDLFILHEKNGYLKIQDSRIDVEVAVADMERRDQSSPLTPHDDIAGDGLDDRVEIETEGKKVRKAK